jgi:hypothetical protein
LEEAEFAFSRENQRGGDTFSRENSTPEKINFYNNMDIKKMRKSKKLLEKEEI